MKLNRGVTALTVAGVAAGIVGGASALSPQVRASIAGTGPDLLSVMRARSPGDRAAGAQTNKHEYAQAEPVAAMLPTSSAASERTPAPVAAVAPAIVPAVVAPAPVAVPMAAAPAVAAVAPAAAPAVVAGGTGLPLAAGAALLPIAGVAAVGGGGGGGSIGFDQPPGSSPPPPPGPAVPEPATWMMMITGIGFLGFALRRRRQRLAERTGSAHAFAKAG
jgi:hypothetical protein